MGTLKRADVSGGMRSSPRMRFPSPPVLCHENWGLRFTGPASDRRHKPSRLQQFEYVLPAMLASGFGSDRRNRCTKCAGGPRPIIARNPAGCAAHLRSQQVRQVCRLITAARALGTLGTLGTARFHGCESTGDVFPGRELDILSLGWVRTRSIHGFSSRRRRRDCRSRPAKSLSSSTTPSSSPPSLFFRPGIQYDIRPGVTSTHPNTWIFDFPIQLTL